MRTVVALTRRADVDRLLRKAPKGYDIDDAATRIAEDLLGLV